ncbi:MAG: restriction endonuclease subunit S, partial [Nitrososphaera sp.]
MNGYAFKPEDITEHGLPIIRIEQLKDSNAPFDFYHGKVPPENYIENDDLIFSWSASLFLQIWKKGRAVLNQHLFKVIPKPNVDKLFLKYCIEFNLPELTKSAHGSTMQHITRRELERFFVSIPKKKDVQSKIAEVLSTVDRAIEQTEALIAKYQRIKTGLMHDLLTRGIDEHGQLRDPATHKFKDSPLGMIPESWEATDIDGLVVPGEGIKPGPFGSSIKKEFYTANGFRVYGQEQVITGTLKIGSYYIPESLYTKLSSFAVRENDILISLVGTAGKVLVVRKPFEPGIINPRLIRLRPKTELNDVEFLKHLFISPIVKTQFDNISQGGTMPVLSGKSFRQLLLPQPP